MSKDYYRWNKDGMYSDIGELNPEQVLFGALQEAKESFYKYIEALGYDSGFWELGTIHGWTLNVHSFERDIKITIKNEETLDGEPNE